jgi:hypothetical protein
MNIRYFFVQIVHILIFGILLLYVGITLPKSNFIYYLLLSLGILAIFAFIIKESTNFWKLWHIFIIGILLIWIGIQKNKSPKFLFNLMIIVGSGSIGYHFIRLLQNIIKK